MTSHPAPQSRCLAIVETLLPGVTEIERAQQAIELGVDGIEYCADKMVSRIPDINAALHNLPIQAAALHLGTTHDLLAAHEPTRQKALDALRIAMTHAVDIGAESVVIVPQPNPQLDLPDLMPFRAPIQIAVELMVWHLRSFSDLAYVFGVHLMLQPRNRYETAFLQRLEQGAELRRQIKFHKHVWLAADSYHMLHTESNPIDALNTHKDSVRHLYLADSNGKLPGQGITDFRSLANIDNEKSGWAVITAYGLEDSPTFNDLKVSVQYLREAGF